MISLLTCCKTHQSVIETSTTITTDTTAITQVAAQDSASIIARVDSIIIDEYNTDGQESITPCVSQSKPGLKCSSQKRNDTSQKGAGSIKKKTKIYGVNLSGTWLSINDSINKKMSHQETTKSEIKQKTPIKTNVGRKIIYVIVGISLLLFTGYVVWKNAVQ